MYSFKHTKDRFLEDEIIQMFALSVWSCLHRIHSLSSYLISQPHVLTHRGAQLLRSWEQTEFGTPVLDSGMV